jgi:hypothetical protein
MFIIDKKNAIVEEQYLRELSPIRRGFAPVLYMFVIGTSVYYRHISKLFIDIVVFVNKELNYFICLFNYFFVCTTMSINNLEMCL